MLRFPMFIALSHLKRRRTQNLISVLGVAVGVMVLTTALSLTNGFVQILIRSTIKVLPHVDMRAFDRDGTKPDPKLEDRLKKDPALIGFGPYLMSEGLLVRRAEQGRSMSRGYSQVYGVNPSQQTQALDLDEKTRKLLAKLPSDGILIGKDLAWNIRAVPGDTVFMYTALGTGLDAVKRKAFKLLGTFDTGNYVIDNLVGFVNLATLQEMLGAADNISGYHLRLHDPEAARNVAARLAQGSAFFAYPWQDVNRALVDQMALQKRVISMVLLLIVIVAGFGIVNVLVLSVFEKTPEIAILRAMGASSFSIMGIFLLEALMLGLAGLLLGNILGIGLSYYFKLRPFPLPGDLYFVSGLPAEPRLADFVLVSLASLLITLLASVIPARRAAAIEPTKIIR